VVQATVLEASWRPISSMMSVMVLQPKEKYSTQKLVARYGEWL